MTNNYSLQKSEVNYNELISNNTDIILAFGVINNQIISKQEIHKKPTILFGAINKDFSKIDFTKKTSEINNFTYLIESQSFLDDLKKFKQLTDFKNIGIIIEKPFVNILPLKEVFDREFKNLNANYRLIPFDKPSDIIANLENIDAVYLAGGFFLTSIETKQLAKVFIDKKLPSFSANGIDNVKDGFLATIQSEGTINQFFRRIALSVESYITGTPLSELSVFIDYKPRLTINYNTAEAVDVPIKYSLIATTDFVGEFKNTLLEKQYDFLDIINTVLDKNLTLQSKKKEVEISKQNIKTAKSDYFPSLTAAVNGSYVDPKLAEISAGQNPEFQAVGNLTLQQTVFSESANANINIKKNLQKAQQENYNTEQLNTIFNASNLYFNIKI